MGRSASKAGAWSNDTAMGSASLGGWSFCRFRPGWSEFQLRNPRLSCVRQFLLETAHVRLEVLNLVRAGAGRPAKVTVQTCGDLPTIRPIVEGQPSTVFPLPTVSVPSNVNSYRRSCMSHWCSSTSSSFIRRSTFLDYSPTPVPTSSASRSLVIFLLAVRTMANGDGSPTRSATATT